MAMFFRSRPPLFAVFLVGALLLSCASSANQPAITQTPTNTQLPGKVVWRDLITNDPEAAKKFYGGLLGWEFRDAGEEAKHYIVVSQNGQPIGGILDSRGKKAEKVQSQWVSSMSVRDVNTAANTVKAAGGKVLWGPKTLGARGPVVLVADPEKAPLALMRAPGGDPADDEPVINGWLWTELWSRQPDSAVQFYSRLAPYQSRPSDNLDRPYFVLDTDGQPRAGIMKLFAQDVRPLWVPYVRVADVAAAVKQAEALGGHVIVSPSANLRNGTVALIQDPTGAILALQYWEPKS
jgi:predicted enzyme related to lactoylglutathione lyase